MSYQDITQSAEFRAELASQRTFMARVYGWMTIGLLITALGALVVAGNQNLVRALILQRGVLIAAILLQLGIAMAFGFLQRFLAPPVAGALFLLYSAITGVTLGAIILLVYTSASVVSTFVITAGMFGAMSVWGITTKRDLTSLGSFMFMGLIGLVLAGIVSMFFGGPSPLLHFVICIVGVIVFTGLTAYDTQKIARSYADGEAGSAIYRKSAIYGAFTLYLDFINLFLYLLQLLGSRRD